ncbi:MULTISPECIES: hypothetical protein [Catenuloplanes]|uniref:Uncharacterized protein n=1 Tax=Catenuloplanes niger TaxID=587534 RepID=A0AAE3ZPA7_9ACTN|nr:hypothetical protein [Catenuloplanes niger]MDR7321788.1 hypothetical protein [Catenuloplanes niger]
MTRVCAVAAPLLLLAHGILRWLGGDGPARATGHAVFLLAMLFFALLASLLRPLAGSSPLATTATAATVLGAATSGWATVGRDAAGWATGGWATGGWGVAGWGAAGDLAEPAGRALPLTGTLAPAGPLLVQFGLLVLLSLLSFAEPRRLPVWSPFAVLAGFLAVAADPGLLPLAALAIGAGLAPLARRRPPPPVPPPPALPPPPPVLPPPVLPPALPLPLPLSERSE